MPREYMIDRKAMPKRVVSKGVYNSSSIVALHIIEKLRPLGEHLVIGPIVWEIEPGSDLRTWCFSLVGGKLFKPARINGGQDLGLTEEMRAAITFHALTHAKPTVVHDMGDELEMAKLCAALWPCAETAELHRLVEQDYAQRRP